MQLGYFSSYIILFIFGLKCGRNDWFAKLDCKEGIKWFKYGMSLGAVIFFAIIILGGGLDGDLSSFEGGLTWQSAANALWESFVAVSMSIGLLALFKKKYNKQNKLVKMMSDNAFAVYVFHSLIIVALSLLMAEVRLIPIVKFAMVAIIGIPLCFLIVHFTIRRIPLIKKIFA
jgi:fucose 4-O-acetylase-like acetyltransferase